MRRYIDHALLIASSVVMGGPLILVFIYAAMPGGIQSARRGAPGWQGIRDNAARLDELTRTAAAPDIFDMVGTSFLVAAGVSVLTSVIAFLAAYAMVFLDRKATRIWFGITLATLYFPIEARMLTTFDVTAGFGLLNTLPGIVLPILPLALATLVFRQHMKRIPGEYLEAARLDGAGPIRFLADFVLPLSGGPIAAVLVITFVIGWNQYLWPLMISIDNALFPLMRGLNLAGSGSGPGMLLAAVSVLPPLVLVVLFLRLMPRLPEMRINN